MSRPAGHADLGVPLIVEAVRAVLRVELGLADHVEAITTPPDSRTLSSEIVDAVVTHRVLPLVTPESEALGLAPVIGTELVRLQRELTLAAMTTGATTVRVSTALSGGGIPHLMLKGPALSQQTTGDPLARGVGDVDALLPPESLPAALEALQRAGIVVHPVGTPTPGNSTFAATQRSQKELTILSNGLEIDLHWRLDDARACLVWSFDELADAAETLTVGGVEIQTLSLPHASVYNASHAGSDAWSYLRAFVDQARLQRGQDLAGLRAEAYRVGAGRRWDLAQVMLARLLEAPTPPVARSIEALGDAMWRWLLAGEGPRERVNARASLRGLGASLASLDSPRAATQRLEAVVWPVGAMADRALGATGDRHPWLYPLATPYFLPKRLVARWRAE